MARDSRVDEELKARIGFQFTFGHKVSERILTNVYKWFLIVSLSKK